MNKSLKENEHVGCEMWMAETAACFFLSELIWYLKVTFVHHFSCCLAANRQQKLILLPISFG